MSLFSKKTPTDAAGFPPATTTYKTLTGAQYTIDREALTLHYNAGATGPAGYDNANQEMTVPAEWIDHAEQRKGEVIIHLVNHGSVDRTMDIDLWRLVVGKKKAEALTADINQIAGAARGRAARPFTVPQPSGKKLPKITAAYRREYPAAVVAGTMMLLDGVVYYGGHAIPAAGATASVESGVQATEKVTAGRVIGGAILAGPAGAIIGAAAKKRTEGQLFITVSGAEGKALMATVPASEAGAATALVNAINAS